MRYTAARKVPDWNKCHHCNSFACEGDNIEVDGRMAYQNVSCSTCGAEWVEVYGALLREEDDDNVR